MKKAKELDLDVEFTEEDEDDKLAKARDYKSITLFGRKKRPTMFTVLKKIHLAKNDKQAYYILMSVAIFSLAVMLIVIIYTVISPYSAKKVPENIPEGLKQQLLDHPQK